MRTKSNRAMYCVSDQESLEKIISLSSSCMTANDLVAKIQLDFEFLLQSGTQRPGDKDTTSLIYFFQRRPHIRRKMKNLAHFSFLSFQTLCAGVLGTRDGQTVDFTGTACGSP
jgi:hypothetical protein